MDLFFIISGFIIVHTTAGDNACHPSSVWNFFVKRFARIWPLYVIWTIAYLVCRHGLSEYLCLEANRLRLLQSFTFIPFANSKGGYDYSALNVGWTINYEVYFYLIFGLAMLCGRHRWRVLGGWFLLSLIVLPQALGHTLAFAHTNYRLKPAYLNIITDPIIWFFASGVLIGHITNTRFRIRSHRWAWLAVGIAVVLPIWQYIAKFRIGHGVTYWGLSLIPLVLVLCLTKDVAKSRGPIARFATYLGNISYSLYLVHPLVQEHLEHLFHIWGIGRLASGFFFMGATTFVSIGLAAISYFCFEHHLCNMLRDKMVIVSRRTTPPPYDRPVPQNKNSIRLTPRQHLIPYLIAIPLSLGLLAGIDWYRAHNATTTTASTVQTQGIWSDGWSECKFTLDLRGRSDTGAIITFWNASPLERHLVLGTDAPPQMSFAPGEKKDHLVVRCSCRPGDSGLCTQ